MQDAEPFCGVAVEDVIVEVWATGFEHGLRLGMHRCLAVESERCELFLQVSLESQHNPARYFA